MLYITARHSTMKIICSFARSENRRDEKCLGWNHGKVYILLMKMLKQHKLNSGPECCVLSVIRDNPLRLHYSVSSWMPSRNELERPSWQHRWAAARLIWHCSYQPIRCMSSHWRCEEPNLKHWSQYRMLAPAEWWTSKVPVDIKQKPSGYWIVYTIWPKRQMNATPCTAV